MLVALRDELIFGPDRVTQLLKSKKTDVHIVDDFPTKYHKRIAEITDKFCDIFAGDTGTTTGATSYHLHLVHHAKLFRCPPYRYPANR